ncbi:MAG: DUF4276 family protein [Phototrophicaceae bacterium]
MIRIHIICEGQTEETFINELLVPYFAKEQIFLIPSLIGKPGHKGGAVNIQRLVTDVRLRLLSDKTSYCTTFFDFYGLPSDFPRKQEASNKTLIEDKAKEIHSGILSSLENRIGSEPLKRFIPYIQMYEFEGLLFSDPAGFCRGIDEPMLVAEEFKIMRDGFETPEHINDSPVTAPSKRIKIELPKYDKVIYGSLAALEIGLDKIRAECKLFDNWLKKLEALKTD